MSMPYGEPGTRLTVPERRFCSVDELPTNNIVRGMYQISLFSLKHKIEPFQAPRPDVVFRSIAGVG